MLRIHLAVLLATLAFSSFSLAQSGSRSGGGSSSGSGSSEVEGSERSLLGDEVEAPAKKKKCKKFQKWSKKKNKCVKKRRNKK